MVFVEPFFEFKFVLGHHKTMKYDDAPKKILIVNLGGIGDVLLSTPALRALRKRYPQAYLAFCGVPRVCDFIRHFKIFDVVMPFLAYEEKARIFGIAHARETVRFLRRLRQERYDLAINMRTIVSWLSAVKMALLFFCIRAKCSLGRDTDGRGFFFEKRVLEPTFGNQHEMDYDLQAVALLGADISDESVVLEVPSLSRLKVDSLLEQEGIGKNESFIGIHIGGIATRRWPLAYYAAFIKGLRKETRWPIVVVAGPGEEYLGHRLQELAGDPFVRIRGGLDVFGLAAFIQRCALWVSGDTGPMHIAAVLRVPQVAIFGGGPLARYDPRRISDKAVVFSCYDSCGPCWKLSCYSLKCLKGIRPSDVVQAALAMIKSTAVRGAEKT